MNTLPSGICLRNGSLTVAKRFQHAVPRRRPLRVAIIGSGPAGFYTAHKLIQKVSDSYVDMYEKLPVPFGLARYGVAPDHPEVKNCQNTFMEAATSSRFRFIGNVSIGSDITLSSLKPHYDAIVFAYGASQDRQLGIPGEDNLQGIYSARAFVGWYNGLPEFASLEPCVEDAEEAVVIGNGNVALDVARMLLKDRDELSKTDIAEYAIAALQKSKIKKVTVVGRRGPAQAAFTTKEVRELMNLGGVTFEPLNPELLPSESESKVLHRSYKRLAQVLRKGSQNDENAVRSSWALRFMLSPKSLDSINGHRLSQVTFKKNVYQHIRSDFSPTAQIEPTDETEKIPAQLAFKSIGYKSEPLPGFHELNIPFDGRKGIIPHDLMGRVLQEQEGPEPHGRLPGLYCTGWVKSGPNGVIAHTMDDAFLTAEAIASDWEQNRSLLNGNTDEANPRGWEGVLASIGTSTSISTDWSDWLKIDKAEIEAGIARGKEREKFSRVEDMLALKSLHFGSSPM